MIPCSNIIEGAPCSAPVISGKGGVLKPKPLCPKCNMRQRRGSKMDRRERAPAGEATSFSVRCSSDEKERWEKAAKKSKKCFRDWVRETLDKSST